MLEFLRQIWGPGLPPGSFLESASIGHPQEEEPCKCHLALVSESGSPIEMQYQWSKGGKGVQGFVPIPEACKSEYWPQGTDLGYFLRAECTPVVDGHLFPPLALVLPAVKKGLGTPRSLGLRLEGEAVEGKTLTGIADVAWCSGVPGKSIARY